MSDIRKVILSIVKFLIQQIDDSNLTSDAKESVEVAVQCLETAYGIDRHADSPNFSPEVLASILSSGGIEKVLGEPLISDEDKAEAENLKNEGNNLIKQERFQEAIAAYSQAIELDRTNAVYYCNRAAAYNKLGEFACAVVDCRKAISLDSTYSKAYGRMGFAYSSLNRHDDAFGCYKMAAEIEPGNESYRSNLRLAQEKVRQMTEGNAQPQGHVNHPVDIGTLLNNPTLVTMATQLMQDPYLQNMMSGFMSSSVSQSSPAQNTGLEALLQAGQQLASHMQETNPQLVASLRQHLNTQGPSTQERNGSEDQQNQ